MGRREQVEQRNAELTKAAANKDLEALANFYEEDAYLLPPGAEVVHGRDGVRARFANFLPNATSLDMQFEVIDIIEAGDIVVDIAHMAVSAGRASGETHSHRSKHIVIWREQADGTLKIAAEAINRDDPNM